MSHVENIIEELVSLILMQEEELKMLKDKINRLKQHIEVYEEYIKGE
jgi:ribosomal protein S15P/S13E